MQKRLTLMLFLLFSPAFLIAGGAVDFALSNSSVRLEHHAVLVDTGAHFTTGLLYNEDSSTWALSVGFNAVDATLVNRELIGGVGFKGIGMNTEYADFAAAIGVGGFLRWQPDFMNGLGFEGQTYFAPSILSFGELVDAYELLGRVTYKVLPQARAFIGAHLLAGQYDVADADNQTGVVDSTLHVGFRIVY